MNRPRTDLTLSCEDQAKIRIYSDNRLFDQAVEFARSHNRKWPKPAQVQGLLQYASNDWNELRQFVTHQKSKADHIDKEFYEALDKSLIDLAKWAKDGSGLIVHLPTKVERENRTSIVCTALAREFIQHLSAEILYQSQRSK